MNIQKPITQGLNYTTQALSEATAKNAAQAHMLKRIPDTIARVDEFIKTSGLKVSSSQREDMIQDALTEAWAQLKRVGAKSPKLDEVELKRLQCMRDTIVQEADKVRLADVKEVSTIEDNIAKSIGAESVNEVVDEVLKTLSVRQDDVIRLRYGIDDGQILTRKQIGDMYGVESDRIRAIEEKGIKRLRHPSRTKVLRSNIQVSPNGTLYSFQTPQKLEK